MKMLWGVVAVIVLAAVATPKNKDRAANVTEPPVLETNIGPTTPLPPSADAPPEGAAVPLPSATDVSTSTTNTPAAVAADPIPTLPGGERYDVTAGLSKPPYDFVFTDPSYGTYGATYTGKRFDTDTGADLTVTVDATSGHIYALRAIVTGADLRAAQWLLPYIASLPFDANDTAESKRWTLNNIGKVRDQRPVERTAYGAKWSLRGNDTSISLSVIPEGLDAWSGRQQ